MTRLMTWFIELQNRFNESRLFKTSTIYVLNWVNDLTSWQLQSRSNTWCKHVKEQDMFRRNSKTTRVRQFDDNAVNWSASSTRIDRTYMKCNHCQISLHQKECFEVYHASQQTLLLNQSFLAIRTVTKISTDHQICRWLSVLRCRLIMSSQAWTYVNSMNLMTRKIVSESIFLCLSVIQLTLNIAYDLHH